METCGISKNRGQGTPEFTVVLGFVALVFLVLMMVVLQKQSEAHSFQVFLDAQKVGSTIATNINAISQNGDGYYRYFSVPDKLYGFTDYDINFGESTFQDSFVYINYSDTTWSTPIITNNVTIISLTKGDNETNCVVNRYGRITINKTCQI